MPCNRIEFKRGIPALVDSENYSKSSSASKTAGNTTSKGEKNDFCDYLYRITILNALGTNPPFINN